MNLAALKLNDEAKDFWKSMAIIFGSWLLVAVIAVIFLDQKTGITMISGIVLTFLISTLTSKAKVIDKDYKIKLYLVFGAALLFIALFQYSTIYFLIGGFLAVRYHDYFEQPDLQWNTYIMPFVRKLRYVF